QAGVAFRAHAAARARACCPRRASLSRVFDPRAASVPPRIDRPHCTKLGGMSVIYLASRSPRRRDLLGQIGVRFDPLLFRDGARSDPETDESVLAGEAPDDYVMRVTRQKARAAWERVVVRRGLRRMPVLAAATAVAVAHA